MKDVKIKKLALFAAAGNLPLLALREAARQGIPCITVAFYNISEFDKLAQFRDIPLYKTQIAYFKHILRILQKEKVDSILMAGKIEKVNLFKVIKFDLTTLRLFLKLKDRSDASLLQGVTDFYESHGIRFVSQKDFFQGYITPKGFLTRSRCSSRVLEDLKWGFQTARHLADLNIGQSLLAGHKVIVSVEGIEGTDRMILRSRDLLLKENYFLKAAKRSQNPKYDLPVFGLTTLKLLEQMKIRFIGLEAGMVLIPEQKEVIEYADRKKMVIYGI
ncbi:MAG: UDP-2,3-diacylglucosamine diphosphatase LpxI [bacterium]|nr:UDP-2,3-diacylglucosamine diphosphatase LpxI [bacterium]